MEKLIEIMEETGLPFAYDHFQEGESPDPPFAVFLIPGSDNFSADGMAYYKVNQAHVELYTDRKDPGLEERVEDALDSRGIFYRKTEVFIDSEQLYEVLYTFEMEAMNHAEEEE